METRSFGSTGRNVSVIGLGCWQFGGDWGEVSDLQALNILSTAVESGVTLIDTADCYGDGHSEELIGEFLSMIGSAEDFGLTVMTKMGRLANPHIELAYCYDNFRGWLDRSRKLLRMDRIPLVQLHCPPTPVYSNNEVYDALDRLVSEDVIEAYGVSVETCDEALTALEHNIASIQIICNILRRKPLEKVLPAAKAKGVAIIARVPLASGLLSGKFTETTTFAPQDHRTFNRFGEAFDVGETFSGVPYDQGVQAGREVARIAAEMPGQPTPSQLALRWLIDQDGITTIIPGASRVEQARLNAEAATLKPLSPEILDELEQIYTKYAAPHVADKW
ncbi:MAG: aldo/keto reductase [Propionibacteriaceae bacterium]|jgi:aryl-alcohol dehydrogenase-like predicted oxidoreductase|nr:aldo/keto reductase [Propionibacteriaceae bacterium]